MSKKSDSSKDVDDVDDDEDDEGEDDEEGEDEERSHNAGRNCLTSGCHSGSGEEHFSIGGTIYTDADGCHADGSSVGRIFISTNDLDLTGMVTESSSDGGSSEISYNSDIKSILDAKCISCHQSGGVKSDVPLTTCAEVTDTKQLPILRAHSSLKR